MGEKRQHNEVDELRASGIRGGPRKSVVSDPDAPEVANLALPDQTFAPTGNLVVIKLLEFEVTRGGVLVPDAARGKINESRPTDEFPKGLVVAAGPFCKFVRRGDLVLVNGSWGKGKHDGGPELRMGPESQVLGVVPPEGGALARFRVVDWETGEVERCPNPDAAEDARNKKEQP